MILPTLSQEICDLAQAVGILVELRRQIWAEFECAIEPDRERLWANWNTLRRAIQHLQSPERTRPVRTVTVCRIAVTESERKKPARVAKDMMCGILNESKLKRARDIYQ